MERVNPKGDWKKAKELVKELLVRAKVQADLEKDRIDNFKKLNEIALHLYNSLPVYDCLFGDSPLAPAKVRFYLNSYSKKLGMSGIKDIFTPDVDIPDFVKVLTDATKWAMKFEKSER